MTETYKLLFRGEVLKGQHPAVVRKRLATLASYSSEHLDLLFSGRPVVVKRQADAATAAHLQGLFRQAGAQLRVSVVAAEDRQSDAAPAESGLQLLPAGSPVLREDERQRWEPREIDTIGLSVADLGAHLGDTRVIAAVEVEIPDLDVAPAGARLADPAPAAAPHVPDTSHLQLQ